MKRFMIGMLIAMTAVFSTRAENGSWQYKLTPYLWAMGLDGDIGARGVTAPIDLKFEDAVKDLEFGGMLAMEAFNGTWGVLVDGSYINLDDDTDTQLGKFRTEVEQLMLEGAAIYRIDTDGRVTVDVGAGGRYIDSDVDVDVPSDRADLSTSEGWADPIILARLKMQFAENCFGVLVGDIGGFGVESDLTWQITALGGYSFTETVSALFGYRYLDYDYEKDDFSYDVATSGLMLGVSFDL